MVKLENIDSMSNLNGVVYLTGWVYDLDIEDGYYIIATLDLETGIATYINTLPIEGKITN